MPKRKGMRPSLRDHIERNKTFLSETYTRVYVPEVLDALAKAGLPQAFIDGIAFEDFTAIANPTTVVERRPSIYRLTARFPWGRLPEGWTAEQVGALARENLPAFYSKYQLVGF